MNQGQDGAATARAWLAALTAEEGTGVAAVPAQSGMLPALAAIAAEAMNRDRSLLIVTLDDGMLADMSNAVEIGLRPLCLALPSADYAVRIVLRATLSLLKSRLARIGDDSEGPAWLLQRQRLVADAELWHRCLAWSERGLDGEAWPSRLLDLFPVRVLPLALARRLQASADWVIVADAARQPEDARGAWPGGKRTMLLGIAADGGPLAAPADAASRLRTELDVLTQELSELELELATAQAEIAAFTGRYHALVGTRMATADGLRAELAAQRAAADPDDLEAARAAASAQAQAERSRHEHERFSGLAAETERPFAAGREFKLLYRRLAQKIHPDRAADEDDRAWRTQLMSEANRAYREGDEAALREVFALWQEGSGREAAADGEALAAQVERLKRRVAEITAELNRLFGSKLYELFTAAGIARRTGRDLLKEMADRLDAEIAGLRTRIAG